MKICFIGYSGHTRLALSQMKLCKDAEFVGIACGSEHESVSGLKNFGLKIYQSYIGMLETEKPDIAVASPVFGLTGKIIIECAERKIDVFVEKPIAGNLQELENVEKSVKKNGIHFSAMHFLRFTPSFYHAAEIVKSGKIGNVKMIHAQKSYKFGTRPIWYSNRNLYTGTIPWVGIHPIDWIYHFTGKKFLSVVAFHEGNPEMTASIQYKLENGIHATVNLDYYRPNNAATHGDDRMRVVGTEGIIEINETSYKIINTDGVNEYFPIDASKLAYDYLLRKEELTQDEIFYLTRIALITRESADYETEYRFW